MRTAIVVVILALLALYLFNPEMEDFKRFVETRSELLLERELGGGVLGEVLSGAGASLAGRYIDRVTDRDDYLFFSTYTIDLDGNENDAEDEAWRFLGIAGQFFEMQRPASFEKGN